MNDITSRSDFKPIGLLINFPFTIQELDPPSRFKASSQSNCNISIANSLGRHLYYQLVFHQ